MTLEQALEAAAHPSYEMRVRAIAALLEAIDTDPRAAEALARLTRDGGDFAVAQAAVAGLLRLGTTESLTIFARAYADADEQYADHYNDELREAVADQPGLLDRLGELADTEPGARKAVDWMTASPWQPEPEPTWFERFRRWWVEQLQGREIGPLGVRDSDYLELFDRHLNGELDAHTFAKEFRTTYLADPRTSDQERHEILRRVSLGCEDLAMPDTEPASAGHETEIDEARFTEIVAGAAVDLRHRRQDWEAQHGGAGDPN